MPLNNKYFFLLMIYFISLTGISQTIFGDWNTYDEVTNDIESVIEVYERDGRAYAKIKDIIDLEKKSAICINCSGKRKNQPILNMDILSGLEQNGEEWSGGKILDPKNGKYYKCYIKLIDSNTLKLRGYIGFSVFGRTAIWKRAVDR